VYIVGDPEMFSFKFNTYHFNGENGRHGGSKLLQHTYMPYSVAPNHLLLPMALSSIRSRNDGTWW
jgi:hypothetical protein